MNETGWERLGRIARVRREKLGLNQEDLRLYGGPAVTTVGKIERAASAPYARRTLQQLEKALGWNRGDARRVVDMVEAGEAEDQIADLETRMLEDDVPDLTGHIPSDDLEVAIRGLPGTDTTEQDGILALLKAMRGVDDLAEPRRRRTGGA